MFKAAVLNFSFLSWQDVIGHMAVLNYRRWLTATFINMAFLPMAIAQIVPLDCENAKNFVEKTTCSNPKLKELDNQLFEELEQAVQQTKVPSQMLELTHQSWIKSRNQCKNTACIEQTYQKRLLEIKNLNTTDQEFVHYFIRIKDQQPDPDLALLQLQMLDEKRVRVLAQTFWSSNDQKHNQSTDFSGYANQAKQITVKDLDSGCILKLREHHAQWRIWQDSPLCGNKNLRFSGTYELQK